MEGWRKTEHANTNNKKLRLDILISGKAEIRARKMIRDKEDDHYITINGLVFQKDETIFNEYTPNNSVQICNAKSDKMTRRNNKFSLMVEDFNPSLLCRKSLNIGELNSTTNLLNL